MSASRPEKSALGIVAGGGQLPSIVAEAAVAEGRPVFIVGIKGWSDAAITEFPHAWVRYGALGKTIELLKQAGCRDLVMIGPLDRPTLFNFRPDMTVLRSLVRVLGLLRRGDDGLLSGTVRYFEETHGFHIRPAEEVAAELVAPAGSLTVIKPSLADETDIQLAIEVVRERGVKDLGQGAVIAGGQILDVEDNTGTDEMLNRVARLPGRPGKSGVLVKLPKPGQERRIDLPTLGLTTVENAAAAGLAGIAYEASGALIANIEGVGRRADELGLFVVGLPAGTGDGGA
ncbi:MAG: UDP-2,3-diacylglucosamine diphosphatase LpxI [Rhodobiaceae bacterium]|mgnify:CR=1 FL=1|nr:UDP-2,3-diacylglucosamine diphosphatase LpxI [Rhodobiaceae bacterium]